MRRWHQERALMLARWRVEKQKHAGDADASCHCLRGAGILRKRRPYGCGNARCGVCHWSKVYAPKRRAAAKRQAIAFELSASS